MSTNDLDSTIGALMAPGKGILAADESDETIARRFEPFAIESTEESRRLYRQMLFTTPGWGESISGVILFDETLRQRADDGRRFVEILVESGITPGIKVDRGAKALAGAPGERVTEGLDGLRERLDEYRTLGARFAKWRAVIAIGEGLPSAYCLDTNAHALARYAALCQEAGLVPIVEPEVLMDGGSFPGALLRGNGNDAGASLHRATSPARRPRADAAQARHGPARGQLPAAGRHCRSRGGDRALSAPDGTGGGTRDRLPLRRAGPEGGDGAPECHECDADHSSVAAQLLLCPGPAGARVGGLARGAGQRSGRPAGLPSSRPLQQRGPRGTVHARAGAGRGRPCQRAHGMSTPTPTTAGGGGGDQVDPLAGKPAPESLLVNVPKLVTAYYSEHPDASEEAQRVAFGTSGHRGSSLRVSFNEAHILAITQAICLYRRARAIDGPLFLGWDTHALSEPARVSALEVLAANGVEVMVDDHDGVTPTPVISRAILAYNRGRTEGFADGIVITPSHNPPEYGGLKYDPPSGGPAGTPVTDWIQNKANEILGTGLRSVIRIPWERARKAATVHRFDYLSAYVGDLRTVIDMELLESSNLNVGVDPLGGASLRYWEAVGQQYGVRLAIVNHAVDPTFRFMTVDRDGAIRMDPSSPYAVAGLIELRGRFDLALANDPDADRYGIVTRGAGLVDPNHYLTACVWYLFRHRPGWKTTAAVGKTVVTSSLIDRVAARLGRGLFEVPVGFKYFVDGFLDGSLGVAGEESAGASFLRRDGTVWTTDKDGLIMGLLAASRWPGPATTLASNTGPSRPSSASRFTRAPNSRRRPGRRPRSRACRRATSGSPSSPETRSERC